MKIKSPKGLLALWTAFLAAGTWILPTGVFFSQPAPVIAAPLYDATPMPTGPGAWVWREGGNVAGAMRALSLAVSGQVAAEGALRSIVESEGQQRLTLVGSSQQVDTVHWTTPVGRTAVQAMESQTAAGAIESEDGVAGVAIGSVTIQPILLELPSLPASPSLLGIEIAIDLHVHQPGSEMRETRFGAIIPVEFGYPFEQEIGPLTALADAMSGQATPESNPAIYPDLGINLFAIDCTRPEYSDPATSLGCFCKCWKEWRDSSEDFDDAFWIAVRACGLIVAATIIGCGALCIGSLVTGGVATPLCVSCLKVLGAEAVLCVTAALATYAAAAQYYSSKRKQCITNCTNLYSSPLWDWREVEPAKVSKD